MLDIFIRSKALFQGSSAVAWSNSMDFRGLAAHAIHFSVLYAQSFCVLPSLSIFFKI